MAFLQAFHEDEVRNMTKAHGKKIDRTSKAHAKNMAKMAKPLHRPPTELVISKILVIRSFKPPHV